jgi:hypothetical protein
MWLCAGKLGVPGMLLGEYANIITKSAVMECQLISWYQKVRNIHNACRYTVAATSMNT